MILGVNHRESPTFLLWIQGPWISSFFDWKGIILQENRGNPCQNPCFHSQDCLPWGNKASGKTFGAEHGTVTFQGTKHVFISARISPFLGQYCGSSYRPLLMLAYSQRERISSVFLPECQQHKYQLPTSLRISANPCFVKMSCLSPTSLGLRKFCFRPNSSE